MTVLRNKKRLVVHAREDSGRDKLIPSTIGLFRSPPEFDSFSMERYAETLQFMLAELVGSEISLATVRLPPTRVPAKLQKIAVNSRTFRYWRRYVNYLIVSRGLRFSVNHILDHAYGHLAHVLEPARTVVTCHDIIPFKHWKGEVPGLGRRRTPPVTVMFSLRGLHRARWIITTTEATKLDLVNILGIKPERVRVIPYGVEAHFRPMPFAERLRTRHALGLPTEGPLVLVVDSGPAYKNHEAIIEAFGRVTAAKRDVRLVHVGSPLSPRHWAHAQRAGVADKIIELGGVGLSAISEVYNVCDVLLFPSFIEGFGWPPLEAMACGLPVVCSAIPAVREVAGEAALLADPSRHDILAEMVLRVINNDSVAKGMTQDGLRRAESFRWESTAARTLELYKSILTEVER